MIETIWGISVGLAGLGICAGIYATWSVVGLKLHRQGIFQATVSLGGLILLYLSAIGWVIFQRLPGTQLSHEHIQTDVLIAGGLAAVGALICACLISDFAPRSWLRASALLLALSWLPLIYIEHFFRA